MASKPRSPMHTFDIDNYLNRFVPRSRLYILPNSISYWFGYRPPVRDSESKPAPVPPSHLLVWLFSFLGGFIGIAIIENVFLALPALGGFPAPIVIASFGAAAILEYNVIESPLSQPRNLILGHFFSATIGVAITKLFLLLPADRFEELRWLAGALAVGAASTIMGVTKTVHPPAGATALLAATSQEMTDLGWWLLPLVLLACCLMLASAMLVNNLYKRFPLYWWTPVDLKALKKKQKEESIQHKDVEKDISASPTPDSDPKATQDFANTDVRSESDITQVASHRTDSDAQPKKLSNASSPDPDFEIRIDSGAVVVPSWMTLSDWESEVLEEFRSRLQNRLGDAC